MVLIVTGTCLTSAQSRWCIIWHLAFFYLQAYYDRRMVGGPGFLATCAIGVLLVIGLIAWITDYFHRHRMLAGEEHRAMPR